MRLQACFRKPHKMETFLPQGKTLFLWFCVDISHLIFLFLLELLFSLLEIYTCSNMYHFSLWFRVIFSRWRNSFEYLLFMSCQVELCTNWKIDLVLWLLLSVVFSLHFVKFWCFDTRFNVTVLSWWCVPLSSMSDTSVQYYTVLHEQHALQNQRENLSIGTN